MGFLKCLYTTGMVGGNAGYYAFPEGRFGAEFPDGEPPHWLRQGRTGTDGRRRSSGIGVGQPPGRSRRPPARRAATPDGMPPPQQADDARLVALARAGYWNRRADATALGALRKQQIEKRLETIADIEPALAARRAALQPPPAPSSSAAWREGW